MIRIIKHRFKYVKGILDEFDIKKINFYIECKFNGDSFLCSIEIYNTGNDISKFNINMLCKIDSDRFYHLLEDYDSSNVSICDIESVCNLLEEHREYLFDYMLYFLAIDEKLNEITIHVDFGINN